MLWRVVELQLFLDRLRSLRQERKRVPRKLALPQMSIAG